MIREVVDGETPDRLYTVTGGRSRAAENIFDVVTLVVAECDPAPGMQSEHARILQICRTPTAVVELSSELRLPVTVVKILLCDLLDRGQISIRQPSSSRPARPSTQLPEPAFLKQVLVGLQKL